ncbi:MAG: tetratricopeptide repeat protein [bacterium]
MDRLCQEISSKIRTHFNLGLALADLGRYPEAIAEYNESLRIKPDYAEAHYSLGDAYIKMGDRSSALREYEILKTMNQNLANSLHEKLR